MRTAFRSKGLVILFSVTLLAGMLTASALAREKYKEKFEKTEILAKTGKVMVGNVSGDIEVKTWAREQVKIEAVKISEASSEAKARENCTAVTIEVTRQGDVLQIETKYPHRRGFWGDDGVDVSVDYVLWIPDKASVEAKSVSGDVAFTAVGGALKGKSVSGDISVAGAAAGADCNSVSGDLTLSDVSGDAYLKSVSGDIEVKKIQGGIDAESVSGDLELSDVSGAKTVSAKTVSGDVDYQGMINPQGRYSFKSHSGNIRLTLPADSAFEFEAETFSGTIDSDFPVEMSGKISPREVRGTVNKGGAYIKLSAFSGSIDLKTGSQSKKIGSLVPALAVAAIFH